MSGNANVVTNRNRMIIPDTQVLNNNNKKTDTSYIRKNVNGWEVIMCTDHNGKLSISAWKTLGRMLRKGEDEAKLHFTFTSTQNRTPAFLKTNNYDSKKGGYKPYIEIDDGLNRTTDSYKQEEKYYKRQYPYASSILTTEEFLSELVPAFEQLLKDKKLNDYVARIREQASMVQKPCTRDYKVIK